MSRWWVVLVTQEWSQVGVAGLPYESSNNVEPGFPDRWLAVFADRSEAEAWAEGNPVVEIQPVEEEMPG